MNNTPQQWFFLALVACWLILSLVAPLVAYWHTSSPFCFAGYVDIAPPTGLLYLLGRRIFPPGDNETKIAIAKRNKKGRVP